MLVDNLKIYNKMIDLGMKCDSCGALDHPTFQCSMIAYRPIPKKVVEKILFHFYNNLK